MDPFEQSSSRLMNTEKKLVVTKGEGLRQVVGEGEGDNGAQ